MVKGKRIGRRSVVVCTLDCGSEGLGFKSHQSHEGFFSSSWLLPRAEVQWAQWEGWDHTSELHPLHGCVFDVALIT